MMLVAARGGNVRAQYQLAVCYALGQEIELDYGEAAHWFRKAAEQGEIRACYSLGVCYANGQGVAQDLEEAVKWFRAAAEKDHPNAQVSLGICLQKGLGVFGSPEDAVKWFRRAAEQGDAAGKSAWGRACSTAKELRKIKRKRLVGFARPPSRACRKRPSTWA